LTKICVQGLWHLGSVTAAGLASVGHDVTGLDFDTDVVAGLRAGKPPIFEPGLNDLVEKELASGRLRFTAALDEVPSDIELLWVAYDTPVDEAGVADVDFVMHQVESVLPALAVNTTVVVSSQLPVGSVQRLTDIAQALHPEKNLTFASAPENLRLGKALETFLRPERVVVGAANARDKDRIADVIAPITSNVEWMSVASAEMTKHAINAFLATSVVFANEIATICELVGADAKEVERGLKSEQRIGPKAYLSPGAAFAGGTLARDIEFLRGVSSSHGLTVPLLESVNVSNDLHKAWVRRKLTTLFASLEGVVVVVWGLTYKPGTDTLRGSLAVELCNWLLERGARLRVHDPLVRDLPSSWDGRVQRFRDPIAALRGARSLLIGTEWPEYKKSAPDVIATAAPGLLVLDPCRFLSSFQSAAGLRYMAVGTPSR
jgi:UDPglucose 6-dehydrogenase